MREGDAFLYMFHYKGTNYYKIGVSTNVKKRLDTISTSSPYEIEVFYVVYYPLDIVYEKEKEVFSRIQYYNVRREFFEFKDESEVDYARRCMGALYCGYHRICELPKEDPRYIATK